MLTGYPGRRASRAVEWEFEKLTIARDFSRNVVTKMLVERAEHGGWELDRVRISPDGTRRVVLRRKIIRMRPRAETAPALPPPACDRERLRPGDRASAVDGVLGARAEVGTGSAVGPVAAPSAA